MKAQETDQGAVKLDLDKLNLDGKEGLFEILGTINDSRKKRGKRHKLVSVLAMVVCATLAGAKSFAAIADWAMDQTKDDLKRLGSRYGRAPSERTFRRVLKAINVQEIDEKTGCWLAAQQALSEGKVLAIDGKTLRGSRSGESNAVLLLSAVVHGSGVVVAQTPVPDDTNEITCVKPLLKKLNIENCTVTADALHTQKETAKHLVEDKKCDYVFIVKGNQPTLKQDIDDLQMEACLPQETTCDKAEGSPHISDVSTENY